jgi:hypothetical protein
MIHDNNQTLLVLVFFACLLCCIGVACLVKRAATLNALGELP